MAFEVGVNSFVSVADADEYFTDRNNQSWLGQNQTSKQAALIRGTDYLVQKYVGRWRGTITSTSQKLPWPRSGVITSDNQVIPSGVIPAAIKNAAAEMGLRGLTNTNLFVDEAAGLGNLKRNRVDVIEKEYFRGQTTQNKYTIVEVILRDYIIDFGAGVQTTRCFDDTGSHPYYDYGFLRSLEQQQ